MNRLQAAFYYLKSKFGLLKLSAQCYLQATFDEDGGFVEVDLDSWQELAPLMERIRVLVA